MPLVFVHGVSNRDTPEYGDNQLARDAFLREHVICRLGLDPHNVWILNPYWGDNGVNFRWGNASLPESFDSMETFGTGLDSKDLRIGADIVAPWGLATEGVFAGVTDFKYETGYGLTQAHSGYFHRPSFYRRLGERLAEFDK